MGKDWEVSQNAPERRAGVHQLMNQFAGGPENSRGWEKLGNSWNDPNLGMEIQDKASREVLDGEGILGSAQGRLDGVWGGISGGPSNPNHSRTPQFQGSCGLRTAARCSLLPSCSLQGIAGAPRALRISSGT